MKIYLIILLIAFAGCDNSDTGQEMVSYPVVGKGDSASGSFIQDGWNISLTNAQLKFGPMKLCSHVPTFYKSGDTMTDCGNVLGEFATASVFDALSDSEQELGILNGMTGIVNSSFYDFGYIWLSTQSEPVSMSELLDEQSVLVEGEATKDGSTINFRFELTITPSKRGISTVIGVETKSEISVNTKKLIVSAYPQEWFRLINFESLKDSQGVVELVQGTTLYNSFYYGIITGSAVNFCWE
jgi:hypothetical protein